MTLPEQIPIDFRVPPPDRIRVNKQAQKIYDILRFREPFDFLMTNDEMVTFSRNHTARVSEIREELNKVGWTVKCVKQEKSGLTYYTIMERDNDEQSHSPQKI